MKIGQWWVLSHISILDTFIKINSIQSDIWTCQLYIGWRFSQHWVSITQHGAVLASLTIPNSTAELLPGTPTHQKMLESAETCIQCIQTRDSRNQCMAANFKPSSGCKGASPYQSPNLHHSRWVTPVHGTHPCRSDGCGWVPSKRISPLALLSYTREIPDALAPKTSWWPCASTRPTVLHCKCHTGTCAPHGHTTQWWVDATLPAKNACTHKSPRARSVTENARSSSMRRRQIKSCYKATACAVVDVSGSYSFLSQFWVSGTKMNVIGPKDSMAWFLLESMINALDNMQYNSMTKRTQLRGDTLISTENRPGICGQTITITTEITSDIRRPPHISHQTFTTAVGSPLFTGHTRAGATAAAESPASALAHWPCCHTPGKSRMRWPQRQVGDRAPAPGQRCSIASATQAHVRHTGTCAPHRHTKWWVDAKAVIHWSKWTWPTSPASSPSQWWLNCNRSICYLQSSISEKANAKTQQRMELSYIFTARDKTQETHI